MSFTMKNPANRYNAYSIIVAAGLLAAFTFFLHGSALQGGWRIDDPILLLYVIEYPDVLGYFFSPEQWQSLGVPFFTPWLVLDYWLDYALFGLNPAAFYAHHLFFVWLAALLTFVLLFPYAGSLWAGAASASFLLGSAVVVVSQELQARHYATGLVFAIAAIMLWLQARRTGSRHSLSLAAVFYLAATLNKEVFVPLPLVLFFLDSAAWKDRIRAMFPFILTAILFVVWRSVMLGKVIGGYGGSFHGTGNIATSLAALPIVFFGDGWHAATGSLILLLAAGLLLRHLSRLAITTLFAAMVALTLPFLAIQVSFAILDLRFAFLPWWGVCILLSLGLGGAFRRSNAGSEQSSCKRVGCHLALLATAIFIFITTEKSFQAALDHASIATELDVQGRFLWDMDKPASYVPFGAVSGILQFQYATSALKRAILHKAAPSPIPFSDSAKSLAGNNPIYRYESACRCMRKEEASTHDETSQTSLQMAIAIDRPKDGLIWRFTVPRDASCYLQFPELNVAANLPCSLDIFFSIPKWVQGPFRFIAKTPNGQWDISPLMAFPEKGQQLKWSTDQIPISSTAAKSTP